MAKDKYAPGRHGSSQDLDVEFAAEPVAAKKPAKAGPARYKALVQLSYAKDGAYVKAGPGEIIELTEAQAKSFLATGAVELAK